MFVDCVDLVLVKVVWVGFADFVFVFVVWFVLLIIDCNSKVSLNLN